MRSAPTFKLALAASLFSFVVALPLVGARTVDADDKGLTISNIGSSGGDSTAKGDAKRVQSHPRRSAGKDVFIRQKPHINVQPSQNKKRQAPVFQQGGGVTPRTFPGQGPGLNDQLTGAQLANLVLEQYLPDPGPYQPEGVPNAGYCRKVPQGGTADEVVFRVRNASGIGAEATTARVQFENGVAIDLNTVALPPGSSMIHEVDIPAGCYGPGTSACTFTMTADANQGQSESSESDNSVSSLCLQPAG